MYKITLVKIRSNWRFNLSRAPWWGGIFERLIGIMKTSLSKVIGKGLLTFDELEKVLLDVECVMNNRPLCYQEEGFTISALTPNLLLREKPAVLLEEDLELLEDDQGIARRVKFIQRCKEHINKRWMNEYIHALEERNKRQINKQSYSLPTGSIVLLKDTIKNKAQWKIGRIEDYVNGADGTLRGYKIRLGNGYIVERPLQLVCDMEIGHVSTTDVNEYETTQEISRPTRHAKIQAKERIKDIYDEEREKE